MSRSRRVFVTLSLSLATLLVAASAALAVGGRTFVVPLTPTGDPDGSGTAVLQVNPGTSEVCYTIDVEDIGVPTEPAAGLGAAHIHDFASGGIFVDLETNWMASGDGYTTSGCAEAARSSLIALLRDPDAYYVNIHTVDAPSGAIAGPLG